MHSTASPPQQTIVSLLDNAAQEINALEREAKQLLHETGNQQAYTLRLRQKALRLAGLIDELEGLDELPAHLRTMIQERVGSFSYEAERALRVDSIFYMSVLLYPENHADGTPNELEEFVAHLRTL